MTFVVAADDRRRDGDSRRSAASVAARVRLERGGDFERAGAAHLAVRPDRAVRRGADRALRPEAHHPLGHRDDRRRPDRRPVHDPALAACGAVGHRRRRRHRDDGDGDGRHRLDALVRRAPRPGARPARRQHARPASCASCRSRRRWSRIGAGAGRWRRRSSCWRWRRSRWSCSWSTAPPTSACRPMARKSVEPAPATAPAFRRGVPRARRGRAESDVLDSRRHVLRLRPQHQWPDPDPFHQLLAATMASPR